MGTLPNEQFTLLTDYDPDAPYVVAFRSVYTNIRSHWDSESKRYYAIALTTPLSYKGQAAVAANIAIASAQSGTPTILVDADLHTPGLQQRFGPEDSTGLSELLSRESTTMQELMPYIHKVFVPDLYLVYAGKALPGVQERNRLLTTGLPSLLADLRLFLEETHSGPGIIVVHTPPVLTNEEAALIGTQVDQTFLTLVSGQTKRIQALSALEQLQRAKVEVAGTITVDA